MCESPEPLTISEFMELVYKARRESEADFNDSEECKAIDKAMNVLKEDKSFIKDVLSRKG